MEVYYSPIGPKKAKNDLQKAKNKKKAGKQNLTK